MDYRELQTVPGLAPSLLGYGAMRFPVNSETKEIDEEKAMALIQRAMDAGITYYDTAWMYHNDKSEEFMGRALARFPRDSYYIATKMPCWEVKTLEDAKEIFDIQLERLGMDHVDFYLLHSLKATTWKKMVSLGVVDFLEQKKKEGVIRYFGFSFHDSYEAFEEILQYPSWDFCQIQLNYMDVNHQAGLKGYKLAEERGIPMVIMEPVKGGSLAQLPEDVTVPLTKLNPNASNAEWAMRWVASLPNVKVILSGMTTMEQLEDNINTCSDFKPLTDQEQSAVMETAQLLRSKVKNGCTGCRYCVPCPAGVDIPGAFQLWNNMATYQNARIIRNSWKNFGKESRPDMCNGCGRCEGLCPQSLPIRTHLKLVTEELNAFTAE